MPPTLVSQQLVLPAGEHQLTVRTATGTGADAVHWELHCASGGPIPLRGGGSVGGVARFAVPADCPLQRLDLRAGQLSGQSSVDLHIDGVAIHRGVTKEHAMDERARDADGRGSARADA